MIGYNRFIILLELIFFSCINTFHKHQNQPFQRIKSQTDTLIQLELKDSLRLKHIKGLFYKGTSGHLYERTFAQKEIEGIDTLVTIEYFNGFMPQELDPLSFTELDGWFAKDKNFAYYYRPVSGGMLIEKLDKANAKYFKVLSGDYRFAVDNKHVFEESQILEKLNSTNLKIERDSQCKIIKLSSGKNIYKVKS